MITAPSMAPVSPSRFLRLLLLLLAPVLLAITGLAQPLINAPVTSFTAAEPGRSFMTVGDVWNGAARVGSTTGDTLSVTYNNSGTDIAYGLTLSVTLPTGFSYVPGTVNVSTSPATPTLSVSALQVGQVLSFTLTDGLLPYHLPLGTSITLDYGVRAATTVASGTYQPVYSWDYSLTDGGALVGASTTQQNILVQTGDTIISITPNQQLKAVGENANFTVTVTNTGLGGLFDVTIDESSLYPVGNNLQFISLTQTAPALAASASNGGSILTLPYLAPGASFTADVSALVLTCGSIVNNVSSTHLANAVPVTSSAPVQLDLRQPLVSYTPPAVTLDYNLPTTVSIPVNNTGQGSAYNFTLQSTLNSRPLVLSNLAAGWTYNASNGLFTYTANGGTIGNGGSTTLSFDIQPTNVCSNSGAGNVNYIANYTNGCGDAYTIPLRTQSITAASDTPSISLSASVSANRIAILESGTFVITLSTTNSTNISDTELVITQTLPASLAYLSNTPSAGTVDTVGQTLTWTVPKANLSSSQTLQIDFSVVNDPCNAGTQPTLTASTSASSTQSCPLSDSDSASFFISNNPGLAASQYFNVAAAPRGIFETGNASADLNRDAGEGEQISFTANYSFGGAYPGVWGGSTYVDNFGGVTGMTLVPGSLSYSLDGDAAVPVPGAAITTLTPGFSVDLSFLGLSTPVAGHNITFTYSTTAPDSTLTAGASRFVTHVTTFNLAGAGTNTSGGCNTPTQSTFTQGAFYTLARAAASINLSMNTALEVCKEELLTISVGNANALQANNVLVTLNNGAAFTYAPAQTPVYGGVFNAGNITYAANGGTNPTFLYTGNPLTGPGTIQVRVTRKANGNTNLTGFSATVDYDSWQTAAAVGRVYSSPATYTPSSLYKATLAVNVSPGSLTVTGPTVSYITYISNTDAGTAYGAVLTNTLPPNITLNTALTNAANSGYPVSASGQNLSWALGDIGSGVTIPITLVANVGTIPGCSLSITTEQINVTWGCDSSVYATVTKVPPSFSFPAGKMQVIHDSTQTVASLCDLGKIVVVVKNTGPTAIEGVIVRDVVPPSAGLSINGTVRYRLNGGALQNAAGAPTGDGSAGNPYTWTSAQIPALDLMVPQGTAGTNQIDIEFDLAATELLASQSPVLSASAEATISCGNAVSSPAQPFTIPVQRPTVTLSKTGRNITADPAAPFTSTVYGGYQDYIEWKLVVSNTGNATANNIRLSDPLSGSNGTAVINGNGLAADTVFTSGQILAIPSLNAGESNTYTITEILGNTCVTASRSADVSWGCVNKGLTTRSDVTTPGTPTSAATIAMTPVIVSGTELTQTITPLNGGRAKVTVTFLNSGGTAYNPVLTFTIPAGSTFDGLVAGGFTSTTATITGVNFSTLTQIHGGTTTVTYIYNGPGSPIKLRYGESVSLSYYVVPTVEDTQNATSYPNLAAAETTLDPTAPTTANISAKLDYTNSCGAAASQTNNISFDPLTPDLDIHVSYPGDILLTDTSSADYTFTITNNGDAGSVADFITIDLPGLGSAWTINSITLSTPGTGGSGGTIPVNGLTPFSSAQIGTLSSGQSAVVTVNAAYSGSPGSLALKLRVTGEGRRAGGSFYGNYSLDQGGRRVVGVVLGMTLQSTSEGATSGTNMLVGEEAIYRLRAAFFGSEGDITNLVIRNTPSNVQATTTGLAYVSQTPTGDSTITPDSVTVGGAAPSPVTIPGSSTASRIDFSLATLTAANINGGNNTFETDLKVRALNIGSNTEGTTLTNNLGVSFTYLGRSFASSNVNDALVGTTTNAGLHKDANLTVRRPSPTLTKTVRNRGPAGTLEPAFTASTTGQAYDVIEYKVVINNPAGTERPLHNLVLTDTVNSKLGLSTTTAHSGVDTNGDGTVDIECGTIVGHTITFDESHPIFGTDGANLARLDPNTSVTLLYRGTLDISVTPSETLGSNASLASYSIPVDSGLVAINQSAPKGTATSTNTTGTALSAARYISASGSSTLNGVGISQTKTLVTTAAGADTSTTVLIGEQLKFRLSISLPQGTTTDLVVKDILPAGLALIGTPVVSIGDDIVNATNSFSQSSQTLTWSFGQCVADASTANRTILIDYVAQVRNSTGTPNNVAGGTLVNNASYSYTGLGGTFTNVSNVTVTLAEPSLTVTHGVRNFTRNPAGAYTASILSGDATSAPDAGDILQYQVTLTNASGATRSAAYDLALAETLPSGLSYVAGSTSVSSSSGLTGTLGEPDISGQSLLWGRTQGAVVNLDLAPGGSITFTYKASLDDTGKPLQAYTNAFVADWTSLDGDPGPNLGDAVAAAGAALGERNGQVSGAPNTYRSALSTTVTSRSATTLTKTKSGDTLPLSAPATGFRVGDLITYTITVTPQEGTLAPLTITDVLPAGLAYVGTTSLLPATGTIPFTYTTPIAGSTAPSPGATGTLTWDLGTLVNTGNNLADNTLTLIYTARVLDAGGPAVPAVSPATTSNSYTNSATVSFQDAAANVLTSAASTATSAVEQPRLTLTKAILTPTVDSLGNYVRRPGETASFRVTITNNGTAPAYNLSVTDTLPAGLRGTAPVLSAATLNGTNVLATLSPASWTAGTGAYVFNLSDTEILLPTQTLVLTYTVTVDNDNALKGSTLISPSLINQFYSLAAGDANNAGRRTYASVGPANATLVVGLQINGSVYHDLQPNNAKDGLEDWSGATKPTVYANLITSGNAVFSTVTIPSTGLFTFDYVPPGTYTIVVTNTAVATTVQRPANWLFQSPTAGSRSAVLTTADLDSQDFGLNQGSFATPLITKTKSGATLPTAAPTNGYRIGDLVTFAVTVNPQEGALTLFKVTDVLPAGLVFVNTVSISPATGGRYTYATPSGANTPAVNATGTLTWNFGNFTNAISGPTNNGTPAAIAAANALTITYRARVTNAGTGFLAAPDVAPATTSSSLTNSANIGYTNPAPAAGAVTATPSIVSLDVEQPRLTVAKVLLSPALNRMAPNSSGQFQVTVTNDGTAPAYNIRLTDTLPVGLRGTTPTLVSTTLAGSATVVTPTWTSGAGTYVFNLSDAQLLQPGQSFVATYNFTVDDSATRGATLTNSALVNLYYSLASGDAQAASRRTYAATPAATASIVVGIAISGSVYNDLQPNNTKDGAEDWSGASNPTVYVNLLSSGSVYASASIPAGNGTYSFTSLPAGTYDLILTDSATSTTATRPTNWPFQSPANGTRSVTLAVAGSDQTAQNFGLYQGTLAAPVISKSKAGDTLAPSGFRLGDLVSYTLDINPQEGVLSNFVITDALPAGLAFVSTVSLEQLAGPARYSYTTPVAGSTAPSPGATGTLTWNLGTFTNALNGPSNNTLRIVYTARSIDSGTGALTTPAASPAATSATLTNSASVSYVNAASATLTAGPATSSVSVAQPRLTIAKVLATPALNRLAPGDGGTFTVTVTNNGSAPAYNLTLTDTFPVGLRDTTPVLTAATLNGSTTALTPLWTASNGTLVFSLSDAQAINPGSTLVLTYSFALDATATRAATLTNSAEISEFFSKPSTDLTERRQYTPGLNAGASVIVGLQISGSVYHDLQPNNSKDAGESWAGSPTVYVNLVNTTSNTVTASATVAAGTGTYSFTNQPAANYKLIVASSATATTADRPANWPFQTPATGTLTLGAVSTDLSDQLFGLHQGSLVTASANKSHALGTLPLEAPANGFRIGDLVTFTLDFEPQEGALTNFVVTDALPAGMAFASTVSIEQVAGTSRFTYTTPSGANTPTAGATDTLTWNFGNFTNALLGPSDNTLRIVYTARVINTGTGALATPSASPTTSTLTNSAALSFTNAYSAVVNVPPATSSLEVEQPLLSLTKERLTPVANNIVRPGETASFRLTVTNSGTAPAYNVALKDTLPVGMRGTAPVLNAATLNGVNILASLNNPAWAPGTGIYSFSLVDAQFIAGGQLQHILPGQTLVLDYTVTLDVAATKGSTLQNSALIQAYYSKPASDLTERRTYGPDTPSTQDIIVGLSLDGYVYDDLTPNSLRDSFENWSTGPTVYVNVVENSSGTVIASTSVQTGSGAYTFTHLAPGDYRLVLATSSGNATAMAPATWLFRAPFDGTRSITLNDTDLTAQNFGLFRGHTVSGRVFRDTGSGGGTANDGVLNGTEQGLGNVQMRLLSSYTELATTRTDGSGNFILSVPVSTAPGATLIVEEVNPPVHLSTGGGAGTTGGSYNRTADRITYLYAEDDPTGLEFGDIPEDSLLTDGTQTILPGAIALYRHTYTAGTAGTVTFTLSSVAAPVMPWTQVLVRDLNANSQIDTGEPIIAATPQTVVAGEEIALIVKDSSPSGALLGARNSITLSSAFTASNASPAISFNRSRQDITIIGTQTATGLQLTKAVDKTTALPGDVITYTITYTNAGSESLSVFFIDDRTPAYTTFFSASSSALPLNLSAFTITSPAVGEVGTLRWSFTGTLAPGSTGTVSFQVKVQP